LVKTALLSVSSSFKFKSINTATARRFGHISALAFGQAVKKPKQLLEKFKAEVI
jgi:hypothetical protein